MNRTRGHGGQRCAYDQRKEVGRDADHCLQVEPLGQQTDHESAERPADVVRSIAASSSADQSSLIGHCWAPWMTVTISIAPDFTR
ncbi:hypothetical protein AC244_16585 [Ensifer adhaerens]|uniref:Uncharacterized protein n=1 Tax=Ensifer adhaerens TaxID=106592 RepID=A0A0L8BT21_ENSAD|nr:hypothetical protein [Ensifer adhaerens]KOF17649.1 hypothetical protein AC244_16585 [Ensifer adhaerens]